MLLITGEDPMQFIVTKDSQHKDSWHWRLCKNTTRSAVVRTDIGTTRTTVRVIAKSAEAFSSRANALRSIVEIKKTISDLSSTEVITSDLSYGWYLNGITSAAATIGNTPSGSRNKSPKGPSSRSTGSSKAASKDTYERTAATRVCTPKISRRTRVIKVSK